MSEQQMALLYQLRMDAAMVGRQLRTACESLQGGLQDGMHKAYVRHLTQVGKTLILAIDRLTTQIKADAAQAKDPFHGVDVPDHLPFKEL